jgi:hypothetical protein
MMRQRHVARHRHLAPADQPRIREGVVGARHGQVVILVIRVPMSPATRWMGVVEIASPTPSPGHIVRTPQPPSLHQYRVCCACAYPP